jgi:signal transduction histidine kinase
MAVPMTERIKLERNKKLRNLHHEIQNCLTVISMGTDALTQSRDDDAMFAELYETVRKNRIEAAKLVDEFLVNACPEMTELTKRLL